MTSSHPFVNALRHETIALHSATQLSGHVDPPTLRARQPTFQGYVRWIAHQRHIHQALKRFPVQPKFDFVEALETELYYLDLEAAWRDELVYQPEVTPYAAYLSTLPHALLGCHWYNVVFAHVVGGNTAVANTARDVLPKGWIETSGVFNHGCDAESLRDALELEASAWTSNERRGCLLETPVAFAYISGLHRELTDPIDGP